MGKYVPKTKVNPGRVGMTTKHVVIDIDVDVTPISDEDKEEIVEKVKEDLNLDNYVTQEKLNTTIGDLPETAENVVDYVDQKTAEVNSTLNEFSTDLYNKIDIVNGRVDNAEAAIQEVSDYAHSIDVEPITEEDKEDIKNRVIDEILPNIRQDDDDIEYNPDEETLKFITRE